jgi:hypothetical protein
MLKRWLTDLVQQPPRVRTKKGAEHIKPFAKANAPRVHYLTVAEESAKQFLTDLLGVGPRRKRRCRGGCGS